MCHFKNLNDKSMKCNSCGIYSYYARVRYLNLHIFWRKNQWKSLKLHNRKYEYNCLTVAESRSSRNFKIFKKLHFSCPRHFKYPRIQISPRINKIGISFWTVQNLKISFWTAWYLEMDSCSLLLFTTNNVRFRHYRATIVIQNKLNLSW